MLTKKLLSTISLLTILIIFPLYSQASNDQFYLRMNKKYHSPYKDDYAETDEKYYDTVHNPTQTLYDYAIIDNFSKPDQWDLHYNHDMGSFTSPYKKGSDPASSYIHWKTVMANSAEYAAIAPPTAKAFSPKTKEIYLLGIRGFFIGLSHHMFYITPKNPIFFKDGIVQNISVMALGMNKSYSLYVEVQDSNEQRYKVYLGNLNYSGWKYLVANLKDYHIPFPIKHNDSLNPFTLKVTKIIFEAENPYLTKAFGTWLTEFGYNYKPYSKSTADNSGALLTDQFDWNSSSSTNLTVKKDEAGYKTTAPEKKP